MENCCESMVKYFMVLCNILFALAGLVLIGFGAYAQFEAKDYLNFLGDNYVNTPIFVIILGAVICAIALFGCCGAWHENKCLIYTYSAVLLIILIAQIGAGIAAFALKGDLKSEIVKNMNNGMKNYGAEGFEGVSTTWDLVQKELHCCGVETYGDWKNATTQFADGGVPDSCCKGGQGGGLVGVSQNVDNNDFDHSVYIYNGPILHHLQSFFEKSTISPSKVYILQPEFGQNNNLQNNQTPPGQVEGCGKAPVDKEKVFAEGCFSLFTDEFNSNLTIVGAVALGVAVGELIAIGFAFCLGKRVGRGGNYV